LIRDPGNIEGLLDGAVFVAHNARFDLEMLRVRLRKTASSVPLSGI
jgi:DNA polymerase III epsilon subunit-like protein